MGLSERIEHTQSLCRQALAAPALAHAEHFLARRGVTEQARVELLRATGRTKSAAPELAALRDAFVAERGPQEETGVLERALLLRAAVAALALIPALPVDDSVKHLFCKEFAFYAHPAGFARDNFSLERPVYAVMAKITVLERFPAGASHWEISGFPRSWLARVAPRQMVRTYRFLALEMRGFQPYFVGHLAGTRHGLPCLMEREFRVGFYRSALAIERQPAIRGMMAGSWLHSRETHRVSPHLAFLNRPYLEAGGIYSDIGPALPGDGFLAGSPERAELYHSGEYRPTFGVVMVTRAQAIAWRRANPELEAMSKVR